MKTLITLIIFAFTTQLKAQTFTNTNSNSTMPKYEIVNGQTRIYEKVGGKTELTHVFTQVPLLTDRANGKNKYQITLTKTDKVAVRTFEISYTYFQQTNKYTSTIKYTIDFLDNRKTKILNESFTN